MDYQNDFPPLFCEFTAYRLRDHTPIWFDNDFAAQQSRGNDDLNGDPEKMSGSLCYMIPGGECSDGLDFDLSDSRVMLAERYGGTGIGDNGGGGRCGNAGKYQVKGIGKNPLVGSGREAWHSYGGLNAADAIYETIVANMLAKIMPIGVAKIYGIVLTGPKAAYVLNTGERGWGALMIRDAALRPAHFLRAGRYSPPETKKGTMLSDVARVRIVNKQLMQRFENVNEFIRFLGNFLMKCANQFGFARIARIMHGSVTASNLCFDGRWIDLTNTGFLPSDENAIGVTSFYEECNAPIVYLQENIDTFNKYNGTKLTIRPLVNYYIRQLNAYFKHHLGYLFALDFKMAGADIFNNPLDYIKSEVLEIFSTGKAVQGAWPEVLNANDPALCLVEYAYLSLLRGAKPPGSAISLKIKDRDRFDKAFTAVFDAAFAANREKTCRKIYAIACFVTASKRSAFSSFYYKGRLDKTIINTLATGEIDSIKKLVGDSVELSDWIFSGMEGGSVVLFKSGSKSVVFCCNDGIFRVGGFSQETAVYPTAVTLREFIAGSAPRVFEIGSFDFLPYLNRILATIISIENDLSAINE